ncbi:hypothetical protein HBI60_260070 [Parastagonospora nodorum]|nr:hypothetical protein HBI60_260070 [Parastagonospora nodorum]
MSPRIYAKIDKAKGRGCLAQYFAWISWIYTKTGVSNSGPASDQLEDRKDLSILPQPPANDELVSMRLSSYDKYKLITHSPQL